MGLGGLQAKAAKTLIMTGTGKRFKANKSVYHSSQLNKEEKGWPFESVDGSSIPPSY